MYTCKRIRKRLADKSIYGTVLPDGTIPCSLTLPLYSMLPMAESDRGINTIKTCVDILLVHTNNPTGYDVHFSGRYSSQHTICQQQAYHPH